MTEVSQEGVAEPGGAPAPPAPPPAVAADAAPTAPSAPAPANSASAKETSAENDNTSRSGDAMDTTGDNVVAEMSADKDQTMNVSELAEMPADRDQTTIGNEPAEVSADKDQTMNGNEPAAGDPVAETNSETHDDGDAVMEEEEEEAAEPQQQSEGSIETWGGSRALSQEEQDAIFVAEFLGQFWKLLAPPPSPPPARDGTGAAASSTSTDKPLRDDEKSNQIGPPDPVSENGTAANPGENGSFDESSGPKLPDATVIAAAAVSPEPPKIAPAIVQDAALLLAKRGQELYHVTELSTRSSATNACETANTGDQDMSKVADDVPKLMDEERASAVHDVEQLLLRLGVLGTKSLAEEMLVVRPPTISVSPADAAYQSRRASYYAGRRRGKQNSEDEDALFSALLNLPGSCHFRQLLGPVELNGVANKRRVGRPTAEGSEGKSASGGEEDETFVRALSLPPNMLTYRAHLRLSLVVSCLSSAEDVYDACKSPLCAFLPSLSVGSGLKPCKGIESTKKDGDHGKDNGRKPSPGKDRSSSQSHHSAGWVWTRNVEGALLSKSAALTGSDIVALWVRAQRNTGAWRQLLGMFRFTYDARQGGLKYGIPTDASTYRAVFMGNHSNASKRTDVESKQVDALIAWAASNQVLFTWARIRDEVVGGNATGTSPLGKKRKLTVRMQGSKGRKNKNAKRSSDDTPGQHAYSPTDWVLSLYKYQSIVPAISNDDQRKIPLPAVVALQSFALRLLSTMHRPILTVVYTKDPREFLLQGDSASAAYSQRLLDSLISQDVPRKVKEEMRKWRSLGTSDRTLARIDRRCFGGKYVPEVEKDNNAESQELFDRLNRSLFSLVKGVLEGLLHSLPAKEEKALASIESAISDWSLIRERYLSPSVIPLFGTDDSLKQLPSLLSVLPTPWNSPEKCNECKDDISSITSCTLLPTMTEDVKTCSCCYTSTHKKCQRALDEGTAARSLSMLRNAYEPLQRVYSLRSPANFVQVPDYTKSPDSIKWSRHTISLKRTVVQGQPSPSWGMSVNHLESSSSSLNDVLSGIFDASSIPDCKNLDCIYPFRLPCPSDLESNGGAEKNEEFRGLFVTKVLSGKIAENCGIKEGDIIVAIDMLPSSHIATNSTSGEPSLPQGYYHRKIVNYGKNERIEILVRQDVSELRLHIYRSDDVDIIEMGSKFLEASENMSSSLLGLFSSEEMKSILDSERWYCSRCCNSHATSSSSPGEGVTRSVYHEASRCRSVVRRLAAQWYSHAFLDEEEDNNESDHSRHVSMRRLDGMFCAIMESHQSSPMGDVGAGEAGKGGAGCAKAATSPFFFSPPTSTSTGRTRLSWAPVEFEKDPYRLLCKGMELMLTSSHSSDSPSDIQEQRMELARNFLPLFSSYCLDSSTSWTPSSSSAKTSAVALLRGPPKSFLDVCPPFLHQPCNCCGVRCCALDDALLGFCSERCKRAFDDGWLMESNAIPEQTPTQNKAVEAKSKVDIACEEYDINSSLVGSTILVLPEDPLLQQLWQKLQIQHNHEKRPVELVVASYLPYEFVGKEGLSEYGLYGNPKAYADKCDKKAFLSRPDVVEGGLYQLIPLLNSHQLKYVLERCTFRNSSNQSGSKSSTRPSQQVWTDVDVLKLHGVVHFSVQEVRHRLKITRALSSAIDSAVADLAFRYGSDFIERNKLLVDESLQEVFSDIEESETDLVADHAAGGGGGSSSGKVTKKASLSSNLSCMSIASGHLDAICSLGCSEQNDIPTSLPISSSVLLREYSTLTDALVNAGVDMIRNQSLKADSIDGNCLDRTNAQSPTNEIIELDSDTDVDEDGRLALSIARKRLKSAPDMALLRTLMNSDDDYHTPLSSPIPPSSYKELLDPTTFQASSEYELCYSDIILFKNDVRSSRGRAKSESLAMRLEAEKEKAQTMELFGNGSLSLQRPVFSVFSERDHSSMPPPSHPFELPGDTGGRFDVILHRMTPKNSAAKSNEQDNSDDEWMPDVEDGTSTGGSNDSYKGRGWGMELIRWRRDRGNKLRVGRVFPSSPAAKAGLHPNDIIISINGKNAESIKSDESLAREVLGCSIHLRSEGTARPALQILSSNKIITGPIALQVLRIVPRQPEKESVQRHEKVIPVDNAAAARAQEQRAREQQLYYQQQQQQYQEQQRQQQQQQQQQYQEQQRQRQIQAQRRASPPAPPQRQPLALTDLYKQGLPQSVLTRAETIVFFEAIEQRSPKLGFRLLLPRYPNVILQNEYHQIIPQVMRDPFRWPKLSPDLWQCLMGADYKRSILETGDIVEREGDWEYKKPVQVLPIDRLLETILKDIQLKKKKEEEDRMQREERDNALRRQQQEQAQREHARQQAQQQQEHARQRQQQAANAIAAIQEQKRRLDEHERKQARILEESARLANQSYPSQGVQTFQLPEGVSLANGVRAEADQMRPLPPPTVHGQDYSEPIPAPVGAPAGRGDIVDLCDDDDDGRRGDDIQRIRGGGDEEEETVPEDKQNREGNESVSVNGEQNDQASEETPTESVSPAFNGFPLTQIPQNQWKNLVVIGICTTQRIQNGEAVKDSTKFLAVVKSVDLVASDGPRDVSISVFYLVKRKLFLPMERLGIQKLSSAVLWAVPNGSEEASFYADWVKKSGGNDYGGKFYDPSQSATTNDPARSQEVTHTQDEHAARGSRHDDAQASCRGSESSMEAHPSSEMRTESNGMSSSSIPRHESAITIQSAADFLVKRLSQRTYSLLGYLPDGRAVDWFHCDPEAIYLRSDANQCSELLGKEHVLQLEYIGAISCREGDREGSELISLPSCSNSRFCCVWGCATADPVSEDDMQALSFSTPEELSLHLNSRHNYIGYDDQATVSDIPSLSLKGCTRVSSGNAIKMLCADLTAAACVRSPALMNKTMPADLSETHDNSGGSASSAQSIMFKFQDFLDLTTTGKGSMKQGLAGVSLEACNMIRLGSRLYRLFAIEESGQYRLSPSMRKGEVGEQSLRESPRSDDDTNEEELLSSIQRDIDRAGSLDSQDGSGKDPVVPRSSLCCRSCCATLESKTSLDSRATCSLCCTVGECIVEIKDDALENQEPDQTVQTDESELSSTKHNSYHGIGCALLSDFIPDPSTSSRRKLLRDAKMLAAINDIESKDSRRQLDVLKSMLLRIARRIPPTLHLNRTTGASAGTGVSTASEDKDAATVNVSLWDDDNLGHWCNFVRHAQNERMLALAFVLLVTSVNKNRMPNWWKATKAGWCSPLMLLHGQTLSSFAMNLYIFDAAIVDGFPQSSGGGRKEQTSPRGSNTHTSTPQTSKQRKKRPVTSGAGRKSDTNIYFERLKKMGFIKRMKTAVQWAKEVGIAYWEDDNNDICQVCKEGGNLLCCEFCCVSQHIECVGVSNSSSLNLDEIDFICEQCMLDMSLLYQEQKEG